MRKNKSSNQVHEMIIETTIPGNKQMLLAEQTAKELFAAVEDKGLLRAGKYESQLAAEIVQLAGEQFGIDKYWHKSIVRCGANTMLGYHANPPDLIIQDDDILFLDFGPIVSGWEADLGRTYVIGNNPLKHKIARDAESAWNEANKWFSDQNSLTGAAFFDYVSGLSRKYGYESGGEIAGHIIGLFPHEQAGPGSWDLDVHPENHTDILLPDKAGDGRHWILEIHFINKKIGVGAFFEQLIG